MTQLFDIIVIGSGPGGYRAAILGALRDLSVAIIEKHQWGGCCLNRGCVPKKTWHQTANLLNQFQQIQTTGISGFVEADFNQAWHHQQRTSEQVRRTYTDYMKRLGIRTFHGHGKLLANNQVEISNVDNYQVITAKNIILATGSEPYFPAGITASNRLISTDELFELDPPPGNEVGLIGSGVIAVEMAFILSKLGKNIHWYSRSPIISKTDFSESAKALLAESLLAAGIDLPKTILPDAFIESDNVELRFANNSTINVDWVLFATGRMPHTSNLGLENTNIQMDKFGFIQTNEYLQTHEPSIYAIGDVRSNLMTANQAISDGSVVIENILNNHSCRRKTIEIPQAIYSSVEVARIGLNEEMAEENGFEPATGFTSFDTSPTAIGQADRTGFLRLIADFDSGKFLGGEIAGKNAGELIHLLALGQDIDSTLYRFAHVIINHPTRGEEIVNAAETLAHQWKMEKFVFDKH